MPVAVFWEHPGVTFHENSDLCATCAHSFLYANINIEVFLLEMLDFYRVFFRLSCSSHHNPVSFCYIINHVFKVSYELTYFVVVNKILTVYLILSFF